MRRSSIIALVDTSGRMQGESIARANVIIHDIVVSLRADPYMLDTAHLSIATFNRSFTPMLDFMPIDQPFDLPILQASPSTPPMLGKAITSLA